MLEGREKKETQGDMANFKYPRKIHMWVTSVVEATRSTYTYTQRV